MKSDFNKYAKKLAIGTVQFGLDYGISNPKGIVKPKEVAAILRQASKAGIDMLDTAIAYGESEVSIGNAMATTDTKFDIISKIPLDAEREDLHVIVERSLKRLHKKHIKAFLTHGFSLYQQKGIRESLRKIKNEGLISQVGVSVYYPREIKWLFDNNIDFDIVQLPYSIFDRRFEPFFPILKENKVEIHVRSVFLQGLFFMNPNSLPQRFDAVKDNLTALRQLSTDIEIPLQAILLNFALMKKEIDKVVIGVTNTVELKENINAINYLEKLIPLSKELKAFAITNENILLPINWK